jgi:hypothetical protein
MLPRRSPSRATRAVPTPAAAPLPLPLALPLLEAAARTTRARDQGRRWQVPPPPSRCSYLGWHQVLLRQWS